MGGFNISRTDEELISILHLSGYLDAHTAPAFEAGLQELIQEKRFRIIVSLKELDYISSAGLGVFMGFVEEVRDEGGDIKISDLSPKIFKVFDLLGFPALFEIYDSLQQAREKLNATI